MGQGGGNEEERDCYFGCLPRFLLSPEKEEERVFFIDSGHAYHPPALLSFFSHYASFSFSFSWSSQSQSAGHIFPFFRFRPARALVSPLYPCRLRDIR